MQTEQPDRKVVILDTDCLTQKKADCDDLPPSKDQGEILRYQSDQLPPDGNPQTTHPKGNMPKNKNSNANIMMQEVQRNIYNGTIPATELQKENSKDKNTNATVPMGEFQRKNIKRKLQRDNSKEIQYGRIWEKFNGKTPMEQRTMEKSN